jgi:hypothetical protein
MKKLILILLLAFCFNVVAQNERTETWFDFPNSQTLKSNQTINIQYNLFIDPFGTAPNGRGGRQVGFEFTAIMGGVYVAPSISIFPQLEDGYVDLVGTVGMNWHMFRTTAIRYYTGLRIGFEFRGEFTPHPMLGASLGADLKIITFKDGTSLFIGGEVWVDHRASQADQFYGDSTGYDGGVIFTNSQTKENGKIKIGVRF